MILEKAIKYDLVWSELCHKDFKKMIQQNIDSII